VKLTRLGMLLGVVLLAVLVWYLIPLTRTPGTSKNSVANKASTNLPCHLYKEHRKAVNEQLAIPVLTDKTAPVYRVLAVTDGDTIVVAKDGKTRIRFMGMDAPEKSTTRTGSVEFFGEQAYQHARQLVEASGGEVRLTYDQVTKDKYGRDLAYVWLKDGRQLNALMVADGYAYSYSSSPKPAYVDRYLALMRDARQQARGLWTVCQ
jgi:micrococcal nuclease